MLMFQMSECGGECPPPCVSEYHLCWNNYQASVAAFLKLISPAAEVLVVARLAMPTFINSSVADPNQNHLDLTTRFC